MQYQDYSQNPQQRNPYELDSRGFQAPIINEAVGLIQNQYIQQIGRDYYRDNIQNRIPQITLSDYVFTPRLRSYFNVDNRYVLKKLLKIIFPFAKSDNSNVDLNDLSYSSTMSNEPGQYYEQQRNLLTPDLYIPLMSFMTFVLMVCLLRGVDDNFDPNLIATYTRNCLIFSGLEVCLYKVVLVAGRVESLTVLDLLAFLNYKYVGLCFIPIFNLLIGSGATLILKFYFSVSFVFYMIAELQVHAKGISISTDHHGGRDLQSKTGIYILSGIQFLTMWLLLVATT